jgi:hypothetical protein
MLIKQNVVMRLWPRAPNHFLKHWNANGYLFPKIHFLTILQMNLISKSVSLGKAGKVTRDKRSRLLDP